MAIEIRITDNYCEIFTLVSDYAVTEKTGERVALPAVPHGSAVALGDYAIREDLGVDDTRPSFDRPIIGYRDADFVADMAAKIQAVVGKDFAPVVAGLALKSAQ